MFIILDFLLAADPETNIQIRTNRDVDTVEDDNSFVARQNEIRKYLVRNDL